MAQIPVGEFRSAAISVCVCGSSASVGGLGCTRRTRVFGSSFSTIGGKRSSRGAVFAPAAVGCGFPWQHGSRFPGVVAGDVALVGKIFVHGKAASFGNQQEFPSPVFSCRSRCANPGLLSTKFSRSPSGVPRSLRLRGVKKCLEGWGIGYGSSWVISDTSCLRAFLSQKSLLGTWDPVRGVYVSSRETGCSQTPFHAGIEATWRQCLLFCGDVGLRFAVFITAEHG